MPKPRLWGMSIASLWEITIKLGTGKITFPGGSVASLVSFLEMTGTEVLPIRYSHLQELERLPMLHREPFDRLPVAQTRAENLRLVSTDALVHEYEPATLR